MSAQLNAKTISIAQTLELLDGPYLAVARGVAEDRYAFWLGSGISFGRVDGLRRVISRVLEFLRSHVNPAHAECRFKIAIESALDLAALTPDERAGVDLSLAFETWPNSNSIVERLIKDYARLLDVQIPNEVEDYLLWEGVDIAATYADPAIEPDVEHLCLALLVLEGVATDLASANWDGLIEKATEELSGGQPTLVVGVRREDLQVPAQKAWLYKFHGCASRAVQDEARYRPFLIGRASQINGWTIRPEHQVLVNRLIGVITSKPTLMMGLSAQDANIQALFAAAEVQSPWAWPGDRPSFVFSGDRIGADWKGMLQNVYRASMTPQNREEVASGALLRAYANPLLVALVLHVLNVKLCELVRLSPNSLDLNGIDDLCEGVKHLRDKLAVAAEGDRLIFVKSLVNLSSRALSLYRDGRAGDAPRAYQPLTDGPVHRIAGNAAIPGSGLRELAVAIGILGLGARDGHWTLSASDLNDPKSGVISVASALGREDVLFVANSHVALRLQHDGTVATDAIWIHGAEIPTVMARSPRAALGRTGKAVTREVSVSDLLSDAASPADLLQQFREALAI